jgi:S-DNA-T family DNA segregation ATPase FtsK/SpoIIIE
MESRIILDTQGAEDLVGRGDMLFSPIGCGKPTRVQGCFVSESEVEAVVTYVKNHFSSTYDQQVMEEIEKASRKEGTSEFVSSSEAVFSDEMVPAAVDVILETGQASASMLQRRLKLGYARAARIVDELQDLGFVGPSAGAKPRAILMTREQWQAMLSGQGSGSSEQLNFDDIPSDSFPQDTD